MNCLNESKGCKGILKKSDNGKSPKGVFKCSKCKSVFRKMINTGTIVFVTNTMASIDQRSIPLKEIRSKKR